MIQNFCSLSYSCDKLSDCGKFTGLMITASHRTFSGQIDHLSGQIDHLSGQIKFGQTNLLIENSLSLQKKMNAQIIFSPYHQH